MKFVDRLKQSFSGTNTAVITLGGAVSGFRTVQQAIADFDLAIGDEVPMGVREGATWELSLFKVDSPTQLSRVRVLTSWNGGAEATFPAGAHEIACTPPAEFLNGQDVADLVPLTNVADAVRILAIDTSGALRTVAASVLKAYTGGASAPADTTAPTAPMNLSSNSVTQTSFNVTFTPGTDNVAVARSEWSLDGTTWTAIGSATSFSVTGRTAATTYTVRIRTVDTSGNSSTPATLSVTTAANTGDTTAPTMSGSISTSGISSSGYTFSYSAGSDNVDIDHYETSIDGGTTWVSNGTSLSRTMTGRPANTTDNLRVRAHDAAGNISNVLTATVTTSAAQTVEYAYSPYSSNAVKTSILTSTGSLNGSDRYYTTSDGFVNGYWNITPNPASAVGGWGTSPTVPPAEITTTQNNSTGKLNGMVPIAKATGNAWTVNQGYLWAPDGAAGPFYYWIKPVDGAPYCLNPSAPAYVVVG